MAFTIKLKQGFRQALLILALGAAVTPLAWSQTGRFENQSEPFAAPSATQVLVAEQSRIVFYRPAGASQGNAASLYVNDGYHASLVAGGYAMICLAPATGVRMGVRQVQVGEPPKDGVDSAFSVDLQRGQTVYMRVSEGTVGRWSLQAVPPAEALGELDRTRRQTHTISRVVGAQECRLGALPAPVPAPVQAPPAQRFVLSGDALFQFGRGGRDGLTGRGLGELDGLLSQLRQEYMLIDRLSVIGHTDPIGGNHLTLSRQRAETVMGYLLSSGLRTKETHIEGRGPAELVVSNCGSQATPRVIACNQPNRRVVIEVSGTRR